MLNEKKMLLLILKISHSNFSIIIKTHIEYFTQDIETMKFKIP